MELLFSTDKLFGTASGRGRQSTQVSDDAHISQTAGKAEERALRSEEPSLGTSSLAHPKCPAVTWVGRAKIGGEGHATQSLSCFGWGALGDQSLLPGLELRQPGAMSTLKM